MRGLPMTGYIGVREQVDKDFHRALLKASLRRWKSKLRGNNRHECLPSFEEAKSGWVRSSQSYRGMGTVDVERITGSAPPPPGNHARIVAFNTTGELPEDDATELEAGANRCAVG